MNFDSDELLRLDNQLCFPLYAAARKMIGIYRPILKPLGITYTQYLVFLVLWESDNITVGDLCRRLYLDSGTLTPLLKKMEEKGYINRCRCPDDERCVRVTLTNQGRQMKEKALDIPCQMSSYMNLTPEEAGRLHELLDKLLSQVN